MEAAIDTVSIQDYRMAQEIRDGSPAAWKVLYDEMGERIFRLMYRLTGDPDLAADLTHDTFVQVVEKGYQYSGRGSLAGWVYRIASNLAKERLRRDSFRVKKASEFIDWSRDNVIQNPPDVELRMVMRRALDDVPEDHRRVLLLYDVDGYTHPDIAEMLGIAVGTSKARLSRARAMLRTALKDAL